MAARKRKFPRRRARFYVYEILSIAGETAYIGKGCGDRLKAQRRRFGLDGREVVRFWREADAFAHERKLIAELRPPLNRAPGGCGGVATPRREYSNRPTKFEREFNEVGPRRYVARYLMRVHAVAPHLIDSSKLETIRQVANGPRI